MKKIFLLGALILTCTVSFSKEITKKEIDDIQNNRLNSLEGQVGSNYVNISRLKNDVSNVGAMSMAVSGIDFGKVKEGEVSVGVGVGHYKDTNALALGMNIGVTDNLTANWKFTATDGDKPESALSAGINYIFSL